MKRSFQLTVLVVAALVSVPAFGVIIDGGNGTGNTTGVDSLTGGTVPGWGYVGRLGAGSVVYLGDGWALTAYHVVGSNGVSNPASLSPSIGGVTYTVDQAHWLDNPTDLDLTLTAKTDLVLLHLTTSPDLPTLNIASTPAQPGTAVTMIGQGRDRAASLTTFNSGQVDEFSGYAWNSSSSSRSLRWGTNVVADGPFAVRISGRDVIGFSTVFDQNVGFNEAQGASGDSGGGVFASNGTLLGIMLAIGAQRDNTASYGDSTYILDVSYYLPQILAIAPGLAVPEPATLTILLATSAVVVLRKRRTR